MAKREEYAIGILEKGGIKYVTALQEHHVALWETGKEAIYFSKDTAKDMCIGFAFNGIAGVPILKQDFITLRNEVEFND